MKCRGKGEGGGGGGREERCKFNLSNSITRLKRYIVRSTCHGNKAIPIRGVILELIEFGNILGVEHVLLNGNTFEGGVVTLVTDF